LNDRIAGFNERENRTWQRFATLFAYIVTCSTGKATTGRELMPEVFPALLEITEEEKKKELDDIRKSTIDKR